MGWSKTDFHQRYTLARSFETHVIYHVTKILYPSDDDRGKAYYKTWDEDREKFKWDLDWKTKEITASWGDQTVTFPTSDLWDHDDNPKAEMMWHSDYYDGPLSGMALYEGNKVWFQVDTFEEDEPYQGLRTFKLYKLSEEEIAEDEKWHILFRKHVGSHCDYGNHYEPVKCDHNNDAFYDQYHKQPDRNYAETNEVLCELMEHDLSRGPEE